MRASTRLGGRESGRGLRRDRIEYDVAYAAFATSGITTLLVRLLSVPALDTGTAGAVGILVAVPLYVVGLLAMVIGAGLAPRLRDERGLLILSGLALAFVLDFLLEVVPSPQRNLVPVVFGVLALSIPATWFLGGRRRRNR